MNGGGGGGSGVGVGGLEGSRSSALDGSIEGDVGSLVVGKAGVWGALYKFTRPHTMRGTILGAVAGCARALVESGGFFKWRLVPRALLGLLALLAGNAFIVGINQIFDVQIDRINKPFLPMAAREMTATTAWAICLASAVAGLAIVRACFSPLILSMYAFGMVFGALYSVPPFRLKRFPALAALCISCVRGFLMNLGVYIATKDALGQAFVWTPPVLFITAFMSLFACVIALAKDLPDIEGDRVFRVKTFASRLGARTLANVVIALLAFNYSWALALAFFAPPAWFRRPTLGLGHAALALWLLLTARSAKMDTKADVRRFYGFIWQLFYAEYLLFPFI